MRVLAILLCGSAVIQSQAQAAPAQQAAPPKAVNLPSSKQLRNTIPGAPQRTNSLPIAMAVSPDKRYLAILNAGYGNVASGYAQSIAILNLETNQLADFPDARLKQRAHQTYFGGLAFSADGTELFASIASLSDPKGEMPNDTGNGIVVYSFADGRLRPSRVIPIEPVRLTEGKKSPKGLFKRLSAREAAPYPAGFALVPPGRKSILVAGNLSDTVMLLYLQGGSVQQFDLSTGDLVPSAYPLNVTISRDGKRAWVSLWNASAVAELDLGAGKVVRQISLLPPESPADNSSHPTAMLLSPDEKALYVTISNRDKIAVIDAESGRVLRMLNARLADQQFGGAIPLGLAQSDDGKRLFVADAGLDAIAVFDTDAQKLDPLGFIPTEWYPTALASVKGELIVASGKGTGTGPNSGLVPAPKNATSTPPPGSNATLPPRGQ